MKIIINVLLLPFHLIKGIVFLGILLVWGIKLFFKIDKDISSD